MKVFACILVAICAISLVYARNPKQFSRSSDFDTDLEEREESGIQYGEQDRRESKWGQDSPRILSSSDSIMDSNDPLSNEWVDIIPFRNKITQRLETSEPLSTQPKMKEKLMKLLEDKVEICKLPSGGKNKVNKQCMGRLTGQMMQMIAAFEQGTQNMPDSYDW